MVPSSTTPQQCRPAAVPQPPVAPRRQLHSLAPGDSVFKHVLAGVPSRAALQALQLVRLPPPTADQVAAMQLPRDSPASPAAAAASTANAKGSSSSAGEDVGQTAEAPDAPVTPGVLLEQLLAAGAEARYVDLPWVINHLRWVVWKVNPVHRETWWRTGGCALLRCCADAHGLEKFLVSCVCQ